MRGPQLSARQLANIRSNVAHLVEAAGSVKALATGLGAEYTVVEEAHRLGACSLAMALRLASASGMSVERLVNGPPAPEAIT